MAAAFEVHREQGGGLSEEIYQESFEIELADRKTPFESKSGLTVVYKGRKLKKRYVPDLIAYGQIVFELKSVTRLTPEHEAQLINYMRISRKPVGYLVNFGPIDKVEWKRFLLSEFL